MPGTLYLVATPLGNLEDITLRALRVLREADLIACEDTRHTRRLLTHFDIKKPLLSYHDHNETERAVELVRRAREGASIAVVSDAGMPGISDPGYRVVKEAIAAGVPVVPVPGPVAVEAALVASGLPTDSFHFGGFLPAKKAQRERTLRDLAQVPGTLVFYDAPHRILATLASVVDVLGDRPTVVARELTKIHEEFIRGSASEVAAQLSSRDVVKGEITLLIGRGPEPGAFHEDSEKEIAVRVAELIEKENMPRMDAIKHAARERGISKREAYRMIETHS